MSLQTIRRGSTSLGTRLEAWTARLASRIPLLRRWIGQRSEGEVKALGASIVVHLFLLLALAMITNAASQYYAPQFRTEFVNYDLKDFATLDQTELAEIKDATITPVGGSFAPVTSAFLSENYNATSSSPVPSANPKAAVIAPEIKANTVQVAGLSLPKPTRMDSVVQIRGNGAEHVENVEGAVDRIAIEILRKLEQGRTLVVWAFDASGSLLAERRGLAEYMSQVYEHIDQLDKSELSQNEGLLTHVIAFGNDRRAMLDEPTSDRSSIIKAIKSVPLDKTGVESTFRTVGELAQKYGRFSKHGQAYQVMLVVITDEVGDDEELLEPAIAAANASKATVYVLGSSALFGRIEGFMDYVDPETKQTFRGLSVRQGPESAALEGIRMPFWYDGPQYDLIDAGFGPYALSRLAGATGGIYFITRLGGHRVTFDPAGMREYKPDWIPKDQYLAMLQKHPLRRGVMRAGTILQQSLPGMPSLNFPAFEAPNFKDVMTQNQEIVARIQYSVDEALGVTGAAPGEPTIANTTALRDREPSRRWQAHYDLIRGRLMAMKIRCMEYNQACARIKRDAPKFAKPESNTWRLVPDTEIHLTDKAAEAAVEARSLLERVMKDHPGTPWALLAQREYKDPLGLKWVETHVPPPPKPREGGNGNPPRNNRQPPQRPPELPKL